MPDDNIPGDPASEPVTPPAPVVKTAEEEMAEFRALLESEKKERQSLQGRYDELTGLLQKVSGFGGAPTPEPQAVDDALMYTDPAAYRAALTREISEKVRRDVQSDLSAQQTREQLLSEFPEMRDKENPFFKDVDNAYAEQLRRFNLAPGTIDYNLIRLTAESVDRKRVREQVSRSTSSSGTPSDAPGLGLGGGGSRVNLTAAQREMATSFGISDKDYADLIKES